MQQDCNLVNSFSRLEGNTGPLPTNYTANPLLTTLAQLSHLDLSGQVVYNKFDLAAQGGYCDVFFGEYPIEAVRRTKVAVKRLRIHAQGSRDLTKRHAEEINIWSKLIHPNILVMLGFVLEGDYPCLVSEWMENGTLTHYMVDHPECDIVFMLVGTANGLAYLHALDIVHSDIKADNILVSQTGEPLICDFGISRRLDAAHTFFYETTETEGTTRWMSPELLYASDTDDIPTHTKASDVWAFGMLVYELLARRPPYDHLEKEAHVLLAIIRGQLPSRPLISRSPRLDKVWSLCHPQGACWDRNAEQRPPIARVLFYLKFCLALTGSGPIHALADFATEPWITRDTLPAAPESHSACTSLDIEGIYGQHEWELGMNETTRSFPTSPVDEAESQLFIDGQGDRVLVRAPNDNSASIDDKSDLSEEDLVSVTVDKRTKSLELSFQRPTRSSGSPYRRTMDGLQCKTSASGPPNSIVVAPISLVSSRPRTTSSWPMPTCPRRMNTAKCRSMVDNRLPWNDTRIP